MIEDSIAPAIQPPSRRAWLVCVALLAVVYALGLNNHWAITPDSGLYLSLGRSLDDGRGMESNGQPRAGIPPALPLTVAACRHVTGGNGYWLINLLELACGLATALVAGRIVLRLGSPELALPVALLTGLSPVAYEMSTRIQTDMPFTLLVTVGLYGFVRGNRGSAAWILLGGTAMLAATMTRLLGVLLLGGAALAILLSFRRPGYRTRILAAAACVAAMAVAMGFWMTWVKSQQTLGSADYLATAGSQGAIFQDSAEALRRLIGAAAALWRVPEIALSVILGQRLSSWVGLVPTVLMIVGLVRLVRRGHGVLVAPAGFYLLFLVLWSPEAIAPRYMLPVLPWLAYGLLEGTSTVVAALKSQADLRWAGAAAGQRVRTAVLSVMTLCLLVGLPKTGREIYWMRQPDFYRLYDNGKWTNYVDLCDYLRHEGRPGADRVMTHQPSVVHYLSGGLIVEAGGLWLRYLPSDLAKVPPEEFISEAARSGARFVIVPLNLADWSDAARQAMAQTPEFAAPPQIFGTLALYDRAAPATPTP
jgi:4-amino-4-deoxy-L-arabinose transferase-like glycosyltransferase